MRIIHFGADFQSQRANKETAPVTKTETHDEPAEETLKEAKAKKERKAKGVQHKEVR